MRLAMHAAQPLGHCTLRRPAGADAEQGIDREFVARGRLRSEGHARVASSLQRGLRIGGQAGLVTREADNGLEPALPQLCGRLETVAAVVARPAGHPDRARMRRDRHREPCHRQPGAPHQRVGGQGGRGGLLDAARGGEVEQVGCGGGGDAMHRSILPLPMIAR